MSLSSPLGKASRSRRILIVEDELLLARDTAYMLKDLGYFVVGIAATADDAVIKTGAFLPDLILMDIRLKGRRDGIEAAAEIRDHFGLPLVFVTAQSDEVLLARARETCPAAFLFKPFSESDLDRTLREIGIPALFPLH